MVATNPQERLAELRNMKRLAELRAMRDSAVGASTSPQIGTGSDLDLKPSIGQRLHMAGEVLAPQYGGVNPATVARNLPRSIGGVIKDTASAVLNPIDTGKALWELGTGAFQLLIPGQQQNEQAAKEFGSFVASRYGSLDNFRRTVEEDPAGVATCLLYTSPSPRDS